MAKTFVLVHGAYHNALHWAAVARRLTVQGHRALAIDMPGHGIHASFPESYLRADWAAFPAEASPSSGVTLEACAQTIAEVVRGVAAAGKPILVGHSNLGCAISLAGEIVPEHLERLVYVTAICPTTLPSCAAYWALPEGTPAEYGSLIVGDPMAIGAVRINPRSPDAAYVSALRGFYYGETPVHTAFACLNAVTPDQPVSMLTDAAAWSRERWGAVPRSYVRCLKDRLLRLPLQDRMIRDADAATPGNRFTVHDLEADHSPFASCPVELADVLGRLGEVDPP